MTTPSDGPSPSQRAAIAGLLLLIAGAALRLAEYGGDQAQWIDEIAVSRNILERATGDLLTRPLAYDQSAPPGFLLIEKVTTRLLGTSDYALRIFPLFGSLIALIVFRRLARRVLDGSGPIVALALFAASPPLVVYAAQVKQYSSDAAAAVLLLWLSVDFVEGRPRKPRAMLLGLAGAAAVWFSQAAVLLLAGLGAALGLLRWRDRRITESSRPPLFSVLALWGLSSVAALLVGLRIVTPATRAYLRQFWAAGLLPVPLTNAFTHVWPLDQLVMLFGRGWQASHGYPVSVLYVVLLVCGLVSFTRHRPRVATLLISPIAVTLGAAIARQYPFSDRLILFLLPVFFLAIAESVERARRRAAAIKPALGTIVVLLLVGPAIYPAFAARPPYRLEDMKPILAHVQAHWRAGDRMYVYYGAGPAVIYYADRYGVDPGAYMLGGCHRGDPRRYLQELDALRGQPRVWIAITHAVPFFHEREAILAYLDAIGIQRDAFSVASHTAGFQYPPAEVLLYDLSDPARLRTATSASFETAGPLLSLPAFACGRGGPLLMTPAPAQAAAR
jgi:hypothetical protein